MAENTLNKLVPDQRVHEVNNAFRRYAKKKNGEEVLDQDQLLSALDLLYLPHQVLVVVRPIRHLARTLLSPVCISAFERLVDQLDTYVKWVRHMNYVIHQQMDFHLQISLLLNAIDGSVKGSRVPHIMHLMKKEGRSRAAISVGCCEDVVDSLYGEGAFSKVAHKMVKCGLVYDGTIYLDELAAVTNDLFVNLRDCIPVQKKVDEAFKYIKEVLGGLHNHDPFGWAGDIESAFDLLCIYSQEVFPRFGSPDVFPVIEKFQKANHVDHKLNESIIYTNFIRCKNSIDCKRCHLIPKTSSDALNSPKNSGCSLKESASNSSPVSQHSSSESKLEPPSLFVSKSTQTHEAHAAKHQKPTVPSGETSFVSEGTETHDTLTAKHQKPNVPLEEKDDENAGSNMQSTNEGGLLRRRGLIFKDITFDIRNLFKYKRLHEI